MDLSQVENSDDSNMKNDIRKCSFSTGNEKMEEDSIAESEATLQKLDLSSSLQQLTEQLKLKIDIIKSSGSNENVIMF
jgi:hypothetical protein